MSAVFLATLAVFAGLAAIGLPVALSMMSAAVAYLVMSGRDIALVGEHILTGLSESFVLPSVPRVILAANRMAAGSGADPIGAFGFTLQGAYCLGERCGTRFGR